MAGSWIKMRTNLATDGRVAAIGRAVSAKPAMVLGALFLFWSMADEQTEDGSLVGHDAASIDRAVGVKGFAAAMVNVGWLELSDSGATVPRFGEHNGESAKKRAGSNKRVAEWREQQRKCNAEALQKTLPEERRGNQTSYPHHAGASEAEPPDAEQAIRRWVGDVLSASERSEIIRAQTLRDDDPTPVRIHEQDVHRGRLFRMAVVEGVATAKEFGKAKPFLAYVASIEAGCERDGRWPGEAAARSNGRAGSRTPKLAEGAH